MAFPLALGLTALAPAASAFADLDCIGTEFCTEASCTPSVSIFGVAFDWAAQAADVETESRDIRLSLADPNVDPDGTSGNLTYFNADDEGLILEFVGADISMTLVVDGGSHRATCTAREAA